MPLNMTRALNTRCALNRIYRQCTFTNFSVAGCVRQVAPSLGDGPLDVFNLCNLRFFILHALINQHVISAKENIVE